MNERPAGLSDDELLVLVQRSWDPTVDAVDHLAVGFGAHHWRASTEGDPSYFVTFDRLGDRHTLESLRDAYAGAAALAQTGLRFVSAPLAPSVVPCATGAVSLTRWLDATAAGAIDRGVTADMLARLHAVDPDSLRVQLPRWRPVVGPGLADQLESRMRQPWSGGPYGARSRAAVAAALPRIAAWTTRYRALGEIALARPWVPTHGEPGHHNQMVTASGTVLVDWETLKLAPAERDLRTLDEGDPMMLEMFDVEWRLSEISEYARWFAGPHGDTDDDRTAFDDLLHELER